MKYVSRVALDVNGTVITDIKSVTEKEFELNKQVNLMSKTGHMTVTQRYSFEIEYVVPEDTTPFNFQNVSNGRLSIEFESGSRVTYTSVYVLKIGDRKVDGENETTQTIEVGAEGRTEE